MKIKVFTNNPWQENTIVLYDETGEAVIIDCGCFSKEEGQRLKSFLVEPVDSGSIVKYTFAYRSYFRE